MYTRIYFDIPIPTTGTTYRYYSDIINGKTPSSCHDTKHTVIQHSELFRVGGWNKFLKWCPCNIAGSSLSSGFYAKLIDEPFGEAPLIHSRCSRELQTRPAVNITRSEIDIFRIWYRFSRVCITTVGSSYTVCSRSCRHQRNVNRTSETEVDGWRSSFLSSFTSSLYRVGNIIIYALRCFTNPEMNTKITLLWTHQQFATPVHTSSSILTFIVSG